MRHWRDQIWVKRILEGDEAAGARLVTLLYPRIRAFLRHLSLEDEEARDLTQQTFAEAWRSLPSYRGDASLSTWLHRIAYFQYTHWLRSRRPSVSLEEVERHECSSPEKADTFHVRLAVEQLPPPLRELVVLYYSQGFSIGEIAQVFDVPPGTVKSRLHQARHRLRELLADSEYDHEIQPSPAPSPAPPGP